MLTRKPAAAEGRSRQDEGRGRPRAEPRTGAEKPAREARREEAGGEEARRQEAGGQETGREEAGREEARREEARARSTPASCEEGD